jgi:glucosamine-6-phosphate deaminase
MEKVGGWQVLERTVSGVSVAVAPSGELLIAVADQIERALRAKPDAVLLFPTGVTPVGVYAELVSRYRRRDPRGRNVVSWRDVRCFNMDEYWGLAPWRPESYAHFMRTHLYEWVDVRPENAYYPDSLAPTPAMAADAYERQLAALGGIDLAFAGIGLDGHLGFNEAGLPRSRTHLVELAESSIRANRASFDPPESMPTTAITIGLDTILEARRIVVLAFGEHKAKAVRGALLGPIGVECPASLVREVPDRVRFYVDEPAAALLGSS